MTSLEKASKFQDALKVFEIGISSLAEKCDDYTTNRIMDNLLGLKIIDPWGTPGQIEDLKKNLNFAQKILKEVVCKKNCYYTAELLFRFKDLQPTKEMLLCAVGNSYDSMAKDMAKLLILKGLDPSLYGDNDCQLLRTTVRKKADDGMVKLLVQYFATCLHDEMQLQRGRTYTNFKNF